EAHAAGALDHPAQHAARANGVGRRRELAEKEVRARLEGQLAAALRQDAHVRIRVTRMPAREGDVVVQLVVGIPAQHDVAEPQPLLQAGEEFLPREVLASQDAVEIEHTDLDMTGAALLDERARLGSRSHFAGVHAASSTSRRLAAAPACRNVTSLPTVTKPWPSSKSRGAENPGNAAAPAHLPWRPQALAMWSTAPVMRASAKSPMHPKLALRSSGPRKSMSMPSIPAMSAAAFNPRSLSIMATISSSAGYRRRYSTALLP